MDPGYYVVDPEATLVTAHSDKESAAPNYKNGLGFQPMRAFLDATGECPWPASCVPATRRRGRPRTT